MTLSGTIGDVATDWLRNTATVVVTACEGRVALTFAPQRFGPLGFEMHPFEALLAIDEGERVVVCVELPHVRAASAA